MVVKFRLVMCSVGVLLGAMPGHADFEASLTGVNGTVGFGYYVGPYYGTLNKDAIPFYCVDFANEAYIGEVWQVNLTPLSSADYSNTRYGGAVGLPNAIMLYREAAWLVSQYAGHPDDYAEIHATIWRLLYPGGPSPSSPYWSDLAAANYQDLDLGLFDIMTNTGPVLETGQVQEFLVPHVPHVSPVPEPSSILLLGTVMILIAIGIRRAAAGWTHRRRCAAGRARRS